MSVVRNMYKGPSSSVAANIYARKKQRSAFTLEHFHWLQERNSLCEKKRLIFLKSPLDVTHLGHELSSCNPFSPMLMWGGVWVKQTQDSPGRPPYVSCVKPSHRYFTVVL